MEKKDDEAIRVIWIPIMMGILERAIITTLVGWKVPGTAGFIGTWAAIKTVGGWAMWSKGTVYGRSVLFAGLMGSALSFLIAIAAGLFLAC
jgi:hypothetical protein